MADRSARTDEWRNDSTASLMDTIIALDDRETAAHFFRDLCTRRELEEMSARWSVVRSLGEGHSYREIQSLTGVSTATITRIAQWARHGTGGYLDALERSDLPTQGI